MRKIVVENLMKRKVQINNYTLRLQEYWQIRGTSNYDNEIVISKKNHGYELNIQDYIKDLYDIYATHLLHAIQ
jgi:hypothetical protein